MKWSGSGSVREDVQGEAEGLELDLEARRLAALGHLSVRPDQLARLLAGGREDLVEALADEVRLPGQPLVSLVDGAVLEVARRARLVVEHAAVGESLEGLLEEDAVAARELAARGW